MPSRAVDVVVHEALVLAPALQQRLPGLGFTYGGHVMSQYGGRDHSGLGPRATVAPRMRCLYVDLDGTLLGPDASLLTGAGGRFSLLAASRAGGLRASRRRGRHLLGPPAVSVFEAARLIGSSAFIFELGCGLVLDGELEWLTDGVGAVSRGRLDL